MVPGRYADCLLSPVGKRRGNLYGFTSRRLRTHPCSTECRPAQAGDGIRPGATVLVSGWRASGISGPELPRGTLAEAPGTGVAPRPPTKLIASTWGEFEPQFSPDGRRVAFTSYRSGTSQVWVCGSDGSNPVQLTSFSGLGAELSSWSPDGRHIAFNSTLKGNWDIYVIGSQGCAPRQLTAENSIDAL